MAVLSAIDDGKGNVTIVTDVLSAMEDKNGNVFVTIKDESFELEYENEDHVIFKLNKYESINSATYESWIKDLPQQFKDKQNIEILIKAFCRQLDELYEAMEQVRNLSVDTATGINLDYEGNILSMTRKDAQVIMRNSDVSGITDEVYRSALKYRTLQTTCDCTYDDIITAIKLIWDTTEIEYYEDPERPAHIFILLPSVSVDGQDPAIGRVLGIRPSGVSLVYTIEYDLDLGRLVEMKADVPEIIIKAFLGIDSADIAVDSIKFGATELAPIEETLAGRVITESGVWYLDGTSTLGAYVVYTATDDDNGKVDLTIESDGSVGVTDDGNGKVSIEIITIGSTGASDDGNGKVIMVNTYCMKTINSGEEDIEEEL